MPITTTALASIAFANIAAYAPSWASRAGPIAVAQLRQPGRDQRLLQRLAQALVLGHRDRAVVRRIDQRLQDVQRVIELAAGPRAVAALHLGREVSGHGAGARARHV